MNGQTESVRKGLRRPERANLRVPDFEIRPPPDALNVQIFQAGFFSLPLKHARGQRRHIKRRLNLLH